LRIVHEDLSILEHLDPVRTPRTNSKEILLPGDGGVLRYREIAKQWEQRGWRIDMVALRRQLGDVAFAIPCPARRESANWVLDTVPLVPAAREASAATERRA
jgi:hypothetical protein